MLHRRWVVDYSLQRRAVLRDLRSGSLTTSDVCDAHDYLLRAARWHGTHTERPCPVCRRHALDEVSYAYGDDLGRTSGRVRQPEELAELADSVGECRVYVVEVCRGCGWNQLVSSYVIGTGDAASRVVRPRRIAT